MKHSLEEYRKRKVVPTRLKYEDYYRTTKKRRNKMNIAVDIDGVVWDIMGVFLEIYNERFKTNIKIEEVEEWYFFPQENFEVVYPDTLKRIDEYPILDEI